jgi:integrase
LDEKKLLAYIDFLKEFMVNESISRQLDFVKWFLRWATNKGHNKNNTFMTFKPKLKRVPKKVIFLDWGELMTVYNFEIPETKNYLKQVRDVFCFCCFTSLRYSDVQNLKRSDVKDDHISITTVKTSDSLVIELNKYSRAILERYKDIPYKDNKALPVISNQKMNDYIKELGKLCGIDEPITQTRFKGNERIDETKPKYELLSTHCGRRTFICNALSMNMSPSVVMEWTGHSDYKAMKPYIDITNQAKKDSMKLFDQR